MSPAVRNPSAAALCPVWDRARQQRDSSAAGSPETATRRVRDQKSTALGKTFRLGFTLTKGMAAPVFKQALKTRQRRID